MFRRDKFLEKCRCVHGDRYNYFESNYINFNTKIEIICNKHGSFFQTPGNHLAGKGCALCANNIVFDNKKFIEKAKQIHGDKYDYSAVKYTNMRAKVKIICIVHGEFLQKPSSHIHQKNGCYRCKKISNIEDFVYRAHLIHDNKYDYTKSIYSRTINKLEILCDKHGSFWQSATSHLKGNGCKKCGKNISKLECKWLDSLNIPDNSNHRQVKLTIGNSFYIVDGFNPETKTVYEYYGSYFHGNPKYYRASEINNVTKTTFGELYLKTRAKEKVLKKAGYKLIIKWSKYGQ